MGVERYSIIVILIFVLTGAGLLYLMHTRYQDQIADLREQLELSRAREAALAEAMRARLRAESAVSKKKGSEQISGKAD